MLLKFQNDSVPCQKLWRMIRNIWFRTVQIYFFKSIKYKIKLKKPEYYTLDRALFTLKK